MNMKCFQTHRGGVAPLLHRILGLYELRTQAANRAWEQQASAREEPKQAWPHGVILCRRL